MAYNEQLVAKRGADRAFARVLARGGERMALFTMTYGEMPTREQFDQAWEAQGIEKFRFGNDPIMGNDELTRDELWDKLQWVWNEYADKLGGLGVGDDPEKQGDWLSCVLACLGIEWV